MMMVKKVNKLVIYMTCILVVTLVLHLQSVQSAIQDAFSTAASTYDNVGQDHNVNPTTNAYFGSNYRRPYPTNTWWLNLVMNGNNPIKTYPYLVKAAENGFILCYPSRAVAAKFVFEGFTNNLILSATQGIGTRKVLSHDDLSVVVGYNGMSSPIVRGQVFHTVEYTGTTPTIRSAHAITSVNGGGASGTVSGTKFKVALNNGQTWLIYTSSSVTWSVSGTGLTATGGFTGSLRAAYMMSANQETVFDTYRSGYPVSGNVALSVSGNSVTYTFRYTKKGSSPVLMFALPHHRDIMVSPQYASPEIKYKSIKGEVVAVVGDQWTLRENLVSDIGFYSRYTIPSGNVAALKAQLVKDQNSYPGPKDPYFGGKAVARLGRLAVIADELGETAIAAKIRGNMKTYINKWFNVGFTATDNRFLYEKSWGGIVSKNSVGSSGADFGGYYYNDHHFHYGYFIYAAACIIKKDVAWGQTYRTKIMELVREVANPSNSDPAFAKLRHKDWYTGHSFAAGLFAFADSRNQESTSEAVNAYYGVYTLGLAYANKDLRDIGRVLMQSEIRSAQKYWQITSADNIYEPVFAATKSVGVLWETKVDYATFFGGNVEYIHGIQMLPFVPISEDLIRPAWIRESINVFRPAFTTAAQGWRGILFQAQATIDKAGAAANIAGLTGVDDGNTMTNTLYWLYTRPDGSNSRRSNPFADIDAGVINDGSPSPSPSPTPSPSPSPTPSPSPSPTPSPSPSPTPSPPPSSDQACLNVRCGSGFSCCNGACYNPNIHTCIEGMLCPVGTQKCGRACYKASIYQCCGGSTLKPLGQSC